MRKERGKPLAATKEKAKDRHKKEMQELRLAQEKQEAREQIQILRQSGLVAAYEQFLRGICKNGLPDVKNVYQLAAQSILKFDKKQREKQMRKQLLQNGPMKAQSIDRDTQRYRGRRSETIERNTQNQYLQKNTHMRDKAVSRYEFE